ncbi:MAG: hypothetical protein OXH66_03450 [Gemmatimonadetes bacterium]|nr:hypothetical protein [Gemmatimonadota bacterium]
MSVRLSRTPAVMQCDCGDVRDCSEMHLVIERRAGQLMAMVKCVDCTMTDGYDLDDTMTMRQMFHRVAMYGVPTERIGIGAG